MLALKFCRYSLVDGLLPLVLTKAFVVVVFCAHSRVVVPATVLVEHAASADGIPPSTAIDAPLVMMVEASSVRRNARTRENPPPWRDMPSPGRRTNSPSTPYNPDL